MDMYDTSGSKHNPPSDNARSSNSNANGDSNSSSSSNLSNGSSGKSEALIWLRLAGSMTLASVATSTMDVVDAAVLGNLKHFEPSGKLLPHASATDFLNASALMSAFM